MEKTRYAHYNINYHFVWIPKYRKSILMDSIENTLEKTLKNASEDIDILSLEIMPDHIHCSVSAPPRMSPSEIINILKGVSSRILRQEYSELQNHKHLWTRTYYVGTAGQVSAETIKKYIEECQGK